MKVWYQTSTIITFYPLSYGCPLFPCTVNTYIVSCLVCFCHFPAPKFNKHLTFILGIVVLFWNHMGTQMQLLGFSAVLTLSFEKCSLPVTLWSDWIARKTAVEMQLHLAQFIGELNKIWSRLLWHQLKFSIATSWTWQACWCCLVLHTVLVRCAPTLCPYNLFIWNVSIRFNLM